MSLAIPRSATCLVPGCIDPPHYILSLRMRREDTSATWAPNLPAFFCKTHANNGSEITLIYAPNTTRKNRVSVMATNGTVVERTTEIKRGA